MARVWARVAPTLGWPASCGPNSSTVILAIIVIIVIIVIINDTPGFMWLPNPGIDPPILANSLISSWARSPPSMEELMWLLPELAFEG